MNKVYFNHKPLLILSDIEILPPHCEDYICVDFRFPVQLFEIIDSLSDETKNVNGAFIISTPEEVFEILRLNYKPVFAAGGLVLNNNSEFLMIFRNNKWDIPKGKIDVGEDTIDAAKREVLEETGVQVSEDLTELAITFHAYKMKGLDCLKRTDWFLMFADDDQELIPEIKEGITEIKWMNIKDFDKLRNQSFPAICDVIDEYIKLISLK